MNKLEVVERDITLNSMTSVKKKVKQCLRLVLKLWEIRSTYVFSFEN